MNKRIVCFVLGAMLLALSFRADAQPPAGKVPRIGFLTTGSASDPLNALRLDAFRQGLRDLGYVEGKTINIEYRYAEGRSERLVESVEELVRLKVDILVASSAAVARAAKKSNVTIPIVVTNMGDLSGLVASLARPGGNVTGLTHISIELLGKRLELLKEVLLKFPALCISTMRPLRATNVWPRKRRVSRKPYAFSYK
jgi:putative tryptophan/tyrosine transport system substrate-binding protein